MRIGNEVLADLSLVGEVYEALAKRHPNSRLGRPGAPAEVALRLLLLKHVRNWSYEVLEREVRANLVYRDFAGVGSAKVQIARSERIVSGRQMRIDTRVVETSRRSFTRRLRSRNLAPTAPARLPA